MDAQDTLNMSDEPLPETSSEAGEATVSQPSGSPSASVPCPSISSDVKTAETRDGTFDLAMTAHVHQQPRPEEGQNTVSVNRAENDTETHQQSLEGILAMIESAVYPHCVPSSPAGSDSPQCDNQQDLQVLKDDVDDGSGEEAIDGRKALPNATQTEAANEDPIPSPSVRPSTSACAQEKDATGYLGGSDSNPDCQRMVDGAALADNATGAARNVPFEKSDLAVADDATPRSTPPDLVINDMRQSSTLAICLESSGLDCIEDKNPESIAFQTQTQAEDENGKGIKQSSCCGKSYFLMFSIRLLM